MVYNITAEYAPLLYNILFFFTTVGSDMFYIYL